jgi:hypothetical protein
VRLLKRRDGAQFPRVVNRLTAGLLALTFVGIILPLLALEGPSNGRQLAFVISWVVIVLLAAPLIAREARRQLKLLRGAKLSKESEAEYQHFARVRDRTTSMRPDQLERRLRARLDAWARSLRRAAHVLTLPDLERVERIGECHPQSRAFGRVADGRMAHDHSPTCRLVFGASGSSLSAAVGDGLTVILDRARASRGPESVSVIAPRDLDPGIGVDISWPDVGLHLDGSCSASVLV